MHAKPAFLITIDTEGDNAWARPREITVRNEKFLPRFQRLCERHGLKPTWLTDHEMAVSPGYQEFGRDVLARSAGEIGMHLHAWTTPPFEPLTDDDLRWQPYLAEYPEPVLREKVRIMTSTLEDTFGVKMTSHRAGRWLLDSTYARALVESGYIADCSVTPGVSWKGHPGDPRGSGGADYTGFPRRPYWLDLEQLDRPGRSPLLELPMTIVDPNPGWAISLRDRFAGGTLPRRILGRLFPGPLWLRPNGSNRREMLSIIRSAAGAGEPMVEFMIHSSEFMPGGSPYFPAERDVEELFEDLEAVWECAAALCRPATLTEFARGWQR
jgi:hypothetical protein